MTQRVFLIKSPLVKRLDAGVAETAGTLRVKAALMTEFVQQAEKACTQCPSANFHSHCDPRDSDMVYALRCTATTCKTANWTTFDGGRVFSADKEREKVVAARQALENEVDSLMTLVSRLDAAPDEPAPAEAEFAGAFS